MRKRKILWNRVAILILVAILAVSVVGMTLFRATTFLWDTFSAQADDSVAIKEDKKVAAQQEKKKYTVVIDAGHGGYDAGSSSASGIDEKDVTLSIALKLGAILEQNEDILVLYTREDDNLYWTSDNREDLMARVTYAIENEADVFVALHMNFSEEGSDINGYDVWVSPTSQANITLSENVNTALQALNYTTSRGIKDETIENLMVLHYNTQPAVLIEMGFLSNASDTAYLTSKEGQAAFVKALSEAIEKTLVENT